MKSGPSWRALEDIPEDQRIESGISFRRGDGDYQQRERKPPG